MKKIITGILMLVMALSLTACGGSKAKGEVTTAVTWEELLAANTLEAVLEKTGGFFTTTTDGMDGGVYISGVAMKDGVLIAATGNEGYTEDLIDGISYKVSTDLMGKTISIVAPTADVEDTIESAGEELALYNTPKEIYINEGEYIAPLSAEDEEWGVKTEGYAYFDAETLLLNRLEVVQKLGSLKYEITNKLDYTIGADFEMVSYDRMSNLDNLVDVTVHYPDGSTKEFKADRDTTLIIHHPDHEQIWSICWDEACTGAVDDLGWVEGDHADIYLCEGQVDNAPPATSRVLELSSFERLFEDSYNTYFQTTYVMDKDEVTTQVRELAWYIDEETGMNLNLEMRDETYEVVSSARARDNAWYSWTAKEGYKVDFFDEFTYAESLVADYRMVFGEELENVVAQHDGLYYPFYFSREEVREDGTTASYKYDIHTGSDYIEHVLVTLKDASGNTTSIEDWYIGGNGPIPGEKDIFTEISSPEDAGAVNLTVVSPVSEKTYSIREDALISWKGEAMYKDEACTEVVTDLSWASGDAKVYVK